MNTKEKLLSHLSSLSIEDIGDKIEKLLLFKSLCLKWNSKYNLYSKGDESRFDERHLLDSLSPNLTQNVSRETKTWLDMGCGTGFPILPLAILNNHIEFTGVEPRSKRVLILNHFRRELELENITFHCSTAEEFSDGTFDIVSCRALGSLEEDWNRAQSHLKKEGCFITFKSSSTLLDSHPCESIPYNWAGDANPYYLIIVRNP